MDPRVELDILLIIIGILIWPEFTFAALLWWLGYPWLGVLAFICSSFGTTRRIIKTITKERVVDTSGKTISEKTEETERE